MNETTGRAKMAKAQIVQPGNSKPLGTDPSPNTPISRVDEIVEKTKKLSFPTGEILPMENFEHKGDRPAGFVNSVADMEELCGKELQESYRAGFPMSAEYTAKVANR